MKKAVDWRLLEPLPFNPEGRQEAPSPWTAKDADGGYQDFLMNQKLKDLLRCRVARAHRQNVPARFRPQSVLEPSPLSLAVVAFTVIGALLRCSVAAKICAL